METSEINDLPGLYLAVGRLTALVGVIGDDVSEIKAYIANDRERNAAEAAADQAIKDRTAAEAAREAGQQLTKESRRKRIGAWALAIFGPAGVLYRWLTQPHHPHTAG